MVESIKEIDPKIDPEIDPKIETKIEIETKKIRQNRYVDSVEDSLTLVKII